VAGGTAGGKQRTDSTQVLARERSLSNLECVGETLRAALDDLAALAPDWLGRSARTGWSATATGWGTIACAIRGKPAHGLGAADGLHLLHALEQPAAAADLKEVASVRLLRQVWQQYYDLSGEKAKWRAGPQAHEGEGIMRSPSDAEARTGKARETIWFGYNVHLTETCPPNAPEDAQTSAMPQLIVQVQTTVANVQDGEMTATIQEDLAQHSLLPEEQIVDTGCIDVELLVKSQQHAILAPPIYNDTERMKAR